MQGEVWVKCPAMRCKEGVKVGGDFAAARATFAAHALFSEI